MADEKELWGLIAAGREGVLATIKRAGLPRLSNVDLEHVYGVIAPGARRPVLISGPAEVTG